MTQSPFNPLWSPFQQQKSDSSPSLNYWLDLLKLPQSSPEPTTPPLPSQPNIAVSKRRIFAALAKANDAEITDGRILPSLDTIPIASGRKLKAAVLYNDLKGFTALVANLHKQKMLAILQGFVSEMTRVASEYGGEVIDCAGDRVMAVFWRPHNNIDTQPICDALCCGFWMQTVMARAFKDVLAKKGLPPIACGIGIDYGDVVVTRVGIRNRTQPVLLGNPANIAAKLEDISSEGRTVISPIIYNNRPSFMTADNGWVFYAHPSLDNPACYYSDSLFKDDVAKRYYVRS